MIRKLLYLILIAIAPSLIQAQTHCANKIILNLVSLNFIGSPCQYTEVTGLDPSIDVYDLNGTLLFNNEVQDLDQSGPELKMKN